MSDERTTETERAARPLPTSKMVRAGAEVLHDVVAEAYEPAWASAIRQMWIAMENARE